VGPGGFLCACRSMWVQMLLSDCMVLCVQVDPGRLVCVPLSDKIILV